MNLAALFDYLIIDEAAQLKEVESTIALQITGVMHAFFIGDPKQIIMICGLVISFWVK